ncbi:MAG: flagellar motor protein MotB [Bacteroidetes bacterium GWC2_40_22]|nr:MAG: flagellar motor protein MotB [Bacteroidetes bacterium GWC2_40_22]
MKAETKFKKRSQTMWSHYTLMIKAVIISALVLMGIQTSLQGQDNKYTKPSWWFGGAAGANLNFYRGSTQELNADLIVPAIFHDGFGVGLYLAPLLEFHKPDTRLGFMLQAGFDSRKGKFDQIVNPCNCPADLSAKLTYLTIEPSLRLAPFKSNFYLYGGPRLAFDMAKSFKYDEGINPDYPDQENPPEITGDFSNMRSSVFSMQIGAGYDINLSSPDKQGQAVLSPFVSFQPYFGQDPRSIETWNITTVRVGAALKFGKGKKIEQPVKAAAVVVVPDPEVKFTVNSPTNIPVQRRVRETFPVRNYVFFDSGSAKISDRYVLITKDQVKDFKEDRLETFTPKQLSGRSQRQMTVYYNVLNILGDRMGRFPATVVRLSGASMEGTEDGLAMAESIKKYLVDIFGIEPGRINTEGRIKPRIPSEQPGATKELDMLREGDRRVTIWSESPELMIQYQTGPNTPLKPVEFVGVQEAPVDSYITFNVEGAEEALTSWSVEVKDDAGKVQNLGPYSKEKVSIPGKTILGTRPEGNYKVTMVGKTKSGKTVRQETPVHMVLWTPPENEEALRYSIIFEINDSDAINIYEKYLTDVVTPKIPKDGTVIIHGHTDIIGNDVHNQELSLARANEVSGIMKSALSKTGRTDVKFEVLGFGEDETLAPFENKYPEERFYNRSVIIDIIPSGK